MHLVDSNIIIYSYLPSFKYLRPLFEKDAIVSEVSKLEVLGYHQLTASEELYFKDVFRLTTSVIPSSEIFSVAIELRRSYNLKLGDSIIASTALVHGLSIYSRNLKDFGKITEIKCIDPVI